jgi:hypothetical protein
MQHHYLKTETEYYQAIEKKLKKFELRKNDRDFKTYDILHLTEVVNGIETGRSMVKQVIYILHGGKYGLDKDYCIMGLN